MILVHLSRHIDAAALLLAVDGAEAYSAFHGGYLSQPKALAGAAGGYTPQCGCRAAHSTACHGSVHRATHDAAHGGPGGYLQVQQVLQVHRSFLRQGDSHAHVLAVQGHIRSAGGSGQSRCHLHIYLRHGHTVLHGLSPVHRQVDGGHRIGQAIGNCLHALHGADSLPHGFGCRLQILHLLTVDPQGNAAAGHHLGHAVRCAGIGHLTLHILAQLHDPPAGGIAALPLGDDDISGDIVCAGAAVHACHGHAGVCGHGRPHGLYIFNGHSPAGHLVRQLRRLFIAASIGHGNSDADGIQVDLRHEHEAPLQRQQCRAHQQHHRHPQHHSLVPQGP